MESTDRYIKCKTLYQKEFQHYYLGEIETGCDYKNFNSKGKYKTFIFYHEFNILVILDTMYGPAANFYTSEDDKFTIKVKLIE